MVQFQKEPLIVSFGHEKGFYRSYGTVKVIFEVDYLS
jgi:hypothetical protein